MINLQLSYDIRSGLVIPASHLDTLACQKKRKGGRKQAWKDARKVQTRSEKLKCRVKLKRGKGKQEGRLVGSLSWSVGEIQFPLSHQECSIKNTGSLVREVSKTVPKEATGSITLPQPQIASVKDHTRVQVKDQRCLLFAALASCM